MILEREEQERILGKMEKWLEKAEGQNEFNTSFFQSLEESTKRNENRKRATTVSLDQECNI